MVNLIQRYSRFTFFLTLLTLVVVMVGAYTRLSDAGLGCPDWPGCYGSMIVPEHTVEKDKAWIEMVHRYIAGSLGLFVFALTVLAFRSTPTQPSSSHRGSILRWLSIMLRHMDPRLRGDDGLRKKYPLYQLRALLLFICVLITFQALLGMWTVTKLLHPTIVMLHLLGGMATLSLIWLAHLRIQNLPVLRAPTLNGAKIASVIGLIIVVLQIALGGWVSTNYAAFACPDFPTCGAQWWPTLDWQAFNIFIPVDRNFEGGFLDHPARVTIHFMHRLGALITATYLFIFGLYCLYKFPALKQLIIGLFIVLGVQLSLGIINIIAHVPLWAAVLHNGVAAILLLCMVSLTYYLLRARAA